MNREKSSNGPVSFVRDEQEHKDMTGYTVHTGSTEKFSQGWDHIFKGKTVKSPAKKKAAKSTKAAKKSGKKRK